MDTEEIAASLRVADRHLKDAGSAFERGVFYDCVYHSASAAENATNAFILWLGGVIPRAHRNAEAMERIVPRVKPELLKVEGFKRMVEKMKELEKHVVMSRYPIEVKEGVFLPPEEFYKKGDAERMLNGARFVLGAVKRFLDVK